MSGRKIALITGASSGIGAEFARQLAADKHDLIVVARREERLKELGGELSARHGISVEVIPADLSDPAEIRRVETRILEAGGLAFLINNAGFGVQGDFAGSDIARYQGMIDVHVTATTRLTHAALPGMIAQGEGAIINVSSVAAFLTRGGPTMYSATKAYINNFSTNLQSEVKQYGIKVQALCPGYTVTEFHNESHFGKWDRSGVPAGLWMTATEVVRVSLQSLKRSQVIVVPGKAYKFSVLLTRTGLGGIVSAIRKYLRRRNQDQLHSGGRAGE